MTALAPSKSLLRMARRIHDTLVRPPRHSLAPPPTYAWERLLRLVRYGEIADERNWSAVRKWLRHEMRRVLATLLRQLESDREALEQSDVTSTEASLGDIYADLLALREEFADLYVNLKDSTVSVSTQNIVLEGVELGPFRIVLDVGAIGSGTPYEVIAEEPNPASGNSATTHPHVQNDHLCEGEGKASIRSALEQGRIFDLFVLIRQILETYNPGSAHVPLDRWSGQVCGDCGSFVDEDDLASCERCETELCSECTDYCECCSRTCCGQCRTSCTDCSETVCGRCALPCSECGENFCPACLENNICDACQKAKEDAHAEEAETAAASEASAEGTSPAVHPVGVGEVYVPA